jgi:ribosomal protein S18 acetylase RimI-like enzyme
MIDVTQSGGDVVLRAVTDDDIASVTELNRRQDVAWWGQPETDDEETRLGFDRSKAAMGSLEAGGRLAMHRDVAVGIALLVGHGQTGVAVDPTSPMATRALEMLVAWLIAAGATTFEAPAQDADRLAALAAAGFVPDRSSFELERPVPLDDLGSASWPPGVAAAPFRPGVDEQELHDLIYSVWTDVAGHTHRPLDEWRSIFIDTPSFDPALIVVARRDDGAGDLAGAALCRTFPGDLGWVAQLAVGRPDRGIGLGRVLLVEAFHRLASAGVSTIGLGVEAGNANALGLYRSVGLEITREWVHCTSATPVRTPSPH